MSGGDKGCGGPHHCDGVDAAMAAEALVFVGQQRVDEVRIDMVDVGAAGAICRHRPGRRAAQRRDGPSRPPRSSSRAAWAAGRAHRAARAARAEQSADIGDAPPPLRCGQPELRQSFRSDGDPSEDEAAASVPSGDRDGARCRAGEGVGRGTCPRRQRLAW